MARKSLSSQVIEEVDRARGLLAPIQDITDPMTSHLVGAVLMSLQRIETMCLSSMQKAMDSVLAGNPLREVDVVQVAEVKELPKRRTQHRAASTRKPVEK